MRTSLPRIAAFGAAAGLAIVVLGTFLSWVRSGTVYYSSYESLGILRHLGFTDVFPALRVFLDVWLGVIPAVAVAIAMYALRLRRTAAALAVILALMMGTIAGAAAVQGDDGDGVIGIASTGPVVTLTGSVLALIGAVLVLVTERNRVKQQYQTGGNL
ncbi:hypothetical protein KIPE111705_45915 [Kibdelosporangium persicum]|uniref:DUF2637 domain-containing protein n=1 Tax=Kibdelosporangium persicum TaxID=2698649 RepID=A0ABX2F208_9PSEU|nr:hypothetical protein [Kibdelosporangium persicum]NRN64918.1 hypothetical protein [Kibdelosporangium persicum]